jgi:hypothetical protein
VDRKELDDALTLLTGVWARWMAETVIPTPADEGGDRVFLRFVNLNPDRPVWQDWALIGHLKNGKAKPVQTATHDSLAAKICRFVNDGAVVGDLVDHQEHMHAQFALSFGDGPPGPRIIDEVQEDLDRDEDQGDGPGCR